jgi:hypothetical protein
MFRCVGNSWKHGINVGDRTAIYYTADAITMIQFIGHRVGLNGRQ